MLPEGGPKVTKCNHYFHGTCLRKWLYVQDSCPLCHAALYEKEKKTPTSGSDAVEVHNIQMNAQNDADEGLIDNDHAMERPIDDDGEYNENQEDNIHDNDNESSDDDSSVLDEDEDELAEDTATSEEESEFSTSEEEGLLGPSIAAGSTSHLKLRTLAMGLSKSNSSSTIDGEVIREKGNTHDTTEVEALECEQPSIPSPTSKVIHCADSEAACNQNKQNQP